MLGVVVARRVLTGSGMTVTVDLPDVSDCFVSDCAYNRDERCQARAITIGDGTHPACDTFCRADAHVSDAHRVSGVGACKVASCRFNSDLECQAPAISVGYRHDRQCCLTFDPTP